VSFDPAPLIREVREIQADADRQRARQVAAIRHAYREKHDPDAMLNAHIRKALEDHGLWVDRFDPDFIVGTIATWLGEHRAVLTGSGVEPEGQGDEPVAADYQEWLDRQPEEDDDD
jgi:hypothetical protein